MRYYSGSCHSGGVNLTAQRNTVLYDTPRLILKIGAFSRSARRLPPVAFTHALARVTTAETGKSLSGAILERLKECA